MEVRERHVVDVPTGAVHERQVGGAHQVPDWLAEDSNGQPLLDSADHRSHMVDAVPQSDGRRQECPSIHPTLLPQLQMNVRYPMPTTKGKVKLSSGEYSTMHAHFYSAWEAGKLAELVDSCINAGPFTASNPKPEECKITGT